MDLPQEVDDYIRESIGYSLGLSVSEHTLTLKLEAYEEIQRRLRDQYVLLLSKLKEKDEVIDRARAESSMNAQALKKFVEENQKLASECSNLLSECKKWENECSLYDHDRDALMDFGNEADLRAKEAEVRVHELEEEVLRLSEEVEFYKQESSRNVAEPSEVDKFVEEKLLESVLISLVNGDEVSESALSFLEANSRAESCQKLLKMWNRLRPSTQIALSLAAEVRTLQTDKEHLRINLHRAEEEVDVLFEENNILKSRLVKLHKQKSSSEKHPSTAGKSNKRKSSGKITSKTVKKIEFNEFDSPRQALSPLQPNSPAPFCANEI